MAELFLLLCMKFLTMKDIYSQIGIVRTYSEGKIIKVIWDDLNDGPSIVKSVQAQLDALREEGMEVVITDISHAKGKTPVEIQVWFNEEILPKYQACAWFRGLIHILPRNLEKKMVNRWNTLKNNHLGLVAYNATSMHDAEYFAHSMMA